VDSVARLVTFADVNDHAAHPRQLSVSLRHEAELVSGRRLLLLDDRGWSESRGSYGSVEAASDIAGRAGEPDIWATKSVEDITETARMVVGPDEPADGRSFEAEAANHWAHLADVLRRQGIVVDALVLSRLPHDVELSDRLLARIGQEPG
jgi:hypothetical protein